jgi:glycerol kinase
MEKFVISVDQGTTSTRAIIFNEAGEALASGQLEHKQIMTQPAGSSTTPWKSGTTLVRLLVKRSVA